MAEMTAEERHIWASASLQSGLVHDLGHKHSAGSEEGKGRQGVHRRTP